jgi:hypothetical protein
MMNENKFKEESNRFPITIKIRVDHGCFHREHSPVAYSIIDNYLEEYTDLNINFEEHESGPEIIVWLAFGTVGLTLAKSVIDLVTAIINARAKGRNMGDTRDGKLLLIVRDTKRTIDSSEEIVLEIYDKDIVSSDKIQKALEKRLIKK